MEVKKVKIKNPKINKIMSDVLDDLSESKRGKKIKNIFKNIFYSINLSKIKY